MADTSSDFNIGGYEFQLYKTEEQIGYRKFYIEDEEGAPSQRGELTRQQTDWSKGQEWWDPIHSEDLIDNFRYQWEFDTWSRPGEFSPLNATQYAASDTNGVGGGRYPNCHSKVIRTKGNLVCLGDSNLENASYYDVLVWDPTSGGAWTGGETGEFMLADDALATTGVTSGVTFSDQVYAMCYDPSDDYVYVIAGNYLHRFKETAATFDNNWILLTANAGDDTRTINASANVFVHNGFLIVYDGEKLFTVDKAAQTLTILTNDGLGPDALVDVDLTSTEQNVIEGQLDLVTGSPEGIYYVKNVWEHGNVTPYVYRVERSTSGEWTGYAVTVLPTGNIAVGITHHLGSVLVAAATSTDAVLANDHITSTKNRWQTAIWHVTGSNLGVVGITDAPNTYGGQSRFMGSQGGLLFIGGANGSIKVYDAINGGLHGWYKGDVSFVGGPPSNMVAFDSYYIWIECEDPLTNRGSAIARFKERDKSDRQWYDLTDGDAQWEMYGPRQDFGLPYDKKRMTEVKLNVSWQDANDRFTVQLGYDDGTTGASQTFSQSDGNVLTLTTPGTKEFYDVHYIITYSRSPQAAVAGTGERRPTVHAIQMRAIPVKSKLRGWQLVLDGHAIKNVNNEQVDPKTVFDNLETIANVDGTVTCIDYWSDGYDMSTGDTITAMIRSIEIQKSNSGEIEAVNVSLVELR